MQTTPAHLAYAEIQHRAPNYKPTIGLVLGSGLGGLATDLTNKIIIPYAQLPGFPHVTVEGHQGNLILGDLDGVSIACLQGRAHSYEGDANNAIKTYVRTLKLLGCETFIATNAAGSLCADVGPGELMLITDHINLQPTNPLIGPNDASFGSRFYPLDQAYNPAIREQLLNVALQENLPLHQGVYISVVGPHYETAAEIRAFRQWGADAVGMSTVPEVLVANHCGMKVGVISMITNYATGLATTSHDHNEVVATAEKGGKRLSQLLRAWIKSMQ